MQSITITKSGLTAVPPRGFSQMWGWKTIVLSLLLTVLLLPLFEAYFIMANNSLLEVFLELQLSPITDPYGYIQEVNRYALLATAYIMLFAILLLLYKITMGFIFWFYNENRALSPKFIPYFDYFIALMATILFPSIVALLIVFLIFRLIQMVGDIFIYAERFFDFTFSAITSSTSTLIASSIITLILFILWCICKLRHGRSN